MPELLCYALHERELQSCPVTDNPLAEGDSDAVPAGTRSRIDTPALDARRMDAALIVTLLRAVRPPKDGTMHLDNRISGVA